MDMTTSPSEITMERIFKILRDFCTYAIETKHASPKLATHIQWKPISCLDRSRSPRGPLISCFKASLRKLIALQSRKRGQGSPKSAEIDDEFWMQSSDIAISRSARSARPSQELLSARPPKFPAASSFFFMPISYYLDLSCLMLWFTTNITSHCVKVYHNHIVSYWNWYHIISIHSLWHSDVSRHVLIMLSQILLYYIVLDFYVIFYHIMLLCKVILRHDIMLR